VLFDDKGYFVEEMVMVCCKGGEVELVVVEDVDYMDVVVC